MAGWRNQRRPPSDGSLGANVRNAIGQPDGGDSQHLSDSVMEKLIDSGAAKGRQSWFAYRMKRARTGRSDGSGVVDRGMIIEGNWAILQELRVNSLCFDAVDLDERIKHSSEMGDALRCGDGYFETNHRTPMQPIAWLGRIPQNRPKRIPSLPMVNDMAREMR